MTLLYSSEVNYIQTLPVWAVRVRVHLTSWGKVASAPEEPPGPKGSKGPVPGKPWTALLGTIFRGGDRAQRARCNALLLLGVPHWWSLGSHWWVEGRNFSQGSPRAPPQHPAVPSCAPHGNGGTAVPSSCRDGSEGLVELEGSLLAQLEEAPGEGLWVPPTHPHLLRPILQALLTPAGHLSHHHSNPSCASQPPSRGRMGWGLPEAGW